MNSTCYVILQNTFYEGFGDPLFATTNLELAKGKFNQIIVELKKKNEHYSTLVLFACQNDKSVELEIFDFGVWYNNKQIEKWKREHPGKEIPYRRSGIVCSVAEV